MVRRVAGTRVNKLSERVAKRGIVAVVVLRLLPVAPFSIVNLVAGASHIRLRDFLLGTLLGMGPGILLTVAFAHQLVASLRHPTAGSFAILIGIGVTLVGVSLLLQRFLGRAKPGEDAAERAREEAAAHDETKEKASDEAARAQDFRETTTPPRDDSAVAAGGGAHDAHRRKRADEVSP
jgi:hypothetical protein